MKFLVAIDNTNASTAAVTEAVQQAEQFDATVVFVTCIEENEKIEGDTIVTDIEQSEEQSYDALENAEAIAENYDVETRARAIPHTDVVQAIVEETEAENPESLYVGHRTIDPDDKYPVSSVARRLITQSPVPVTVVTEDNVSN